MSSHKEHRPVVLKFGGTSVQDANAFRQVAEIVKDAISNKPVVVVSAMSGVTDALLKAVAAAWRAPESNPLEILDPHFDRHVEAAESLLTGARQGEYLRRLSDVREEIVHLLRTIRSYRGVLAPLQDEIVSFGERLSSRLLADFLSETGQPSVPVDARRCIVTDEAFTRATPLFRETFEKTRREIEPVLADGIVPVLGGFIGATADGATTTLGRGGSDYSGTILGAALGAAEVQIWTDVSGIYSADPRLVTEVRRVERISYAEATDLALYGAKVLHPKTIEPVEKLGIPVSIRNTFKPHNGYSVVGPESAVEAGEIGAVTHRTGVAVVQFTPAAGVAALGQLGAATDIFEENGVPVEHLAASRAGLSATVEEGDALDKALKKLGGIGRVDVTRGVAVICLVGNFPDDRIDASRRVVESLAAFDARPLHPHPSPNARLYLVDESVVGDAVRALHRRCVEER